MRSPETTNTRKKPPDKFKCCENFDNYSNEGSSLIDHLSSHLTAINCIFDNDLNQKIKKGEFTSVSKLCPGCQESDLFGDLQHHPLFQINVSSWTPDIEVFQEKLFEAVNTHIVSCSYLTRMGELIAEMKNSVESEDKTDKAQGSPKMNSTQKSGCDNNEAMNISSTSESESNKDRRRERQRNKKILKKFASDFESSRESILEADREAKASGRTVLEHLEVIGWSQCPVCFSPISEEKLISHLFASHNTNFYKLCSKSNNFSFSNSCSLTHNSSDSS